MFFRQSDNQINISEDRQHSAMDQNFEDNVKYSFYQAKKHIEKLENELKGQSREIHEIKEKIDLFLLEISKKAANAENLVLEPQNPRIQESKKNVSTGNDGVFRQTDDRQTTTFRQSDSLSTVETLKNDLFSRFRALTDQEFKLFMLIYELEEQKNAPITYAELAEKSGLSQSSIRDHIANILVKKIPLHKEISTNRRVFLSILPELRDLTLVERLLRLRQPTVSHQSTLKDLFIHNK